MRNGRVLVLHSALVALALLSGSVRAMLIGQRRHAATAAPWRLRANVDDVTDADADAANDGAADAGADAANDGAADADADAANDGAVDAGGDAANDGDAADGDDEAAAGTIKERTIWYDMEWRVQRSRLEHRVRQKHRVSTNCRPLNRNRRRREARESAECPPQCRQKVLRRPRRHLSFEEASRWVQALGFAAPTRDGGKCDRERRCIFGETVSRGACYNKHLHAGDEHVGHGERVASMGALGREAEPVHPEQAAGVLQSPMARLGAFPPGRRERDADPRLTQGELPVVLAASPSLGVGLYDNSGFGNTA